MNIIISPRELAKISNSSTDVLHFNSLIVLNIKSKQYESHSNTYLQFLNKLVSITVTLNYVGMDTLVPNIWFFTSRILTSQNFWSKNFVIA